MQAKKPLVSDANQDLIARICMKDKCALETLYENYSGRMLGLAIHIMGNSSNAEDIIHDVFIEVWNKATQYDARKASVLGWLLLRVRSRCLDHIRKAQTRKKYLEKQVNETEYKAKSNSETYTDSKFIEKSLNLLSDKQRFVIEMNYFKGLTCAEISKYYNIPLGTVKTRLLSAMKKLQQSAVKIRELRL